MAFHHFSAAPADEEFLEPVLEPCCAEVHDTLRSWNPHGSMDYGAIGAELRAAERALQAVRLARETRPEAAGLGAGESLRMQLVLPPRRLAGRTPSRRRGAGGLLRRLASGELVDLDRVQQGPVANAVNAPGVLPLSALGNASAARSRDDDAQSMSSLAAASARRARGSRGAREGRAARAARGAEHGWPGRLERIEIWPAYFWP